MAKAKIKIHPSVIAIIGDNKFRILKNNKKELVLESVKFKNQVSLKKTVAFTGDQLTVAIEDSSVLEGIETIEFGKDGVSKKLVKKVEPRQQSGGTSRTPPKDPSRLSNPA